MARQGKKSASNFDSKKLLLQNTKDIQKNTKSIDHLIGDVQLLKGETKGIRQRLDRHDEHFKNILVDIRQFKEGMEEAFAHWNTTYLDGQDKVMTILTRMEQEAASTKMGLGRAEDRIENHEGRLVQLEASRT